MLVCIDHVAIISSDYQRSKRFYTEILGLSILDETYQEHRGTYKLTLALNGVYIIELFGFPDAPARLTYPEARGLRHIAFRVENLNEVMSVLTARGIVFEGVRRDNIRGKNFVFFSDPDNLPIELYEK